MCTCVQVHTQKCSLVPLLSHCKASPTLLTPSEPRACLFCSQTPPHAPASPSSCSPNSSLNYLHVNSLGGSPVFETGKGKWTEETEKEQGGPKAQVPLAWQVLRWTLGNSTQKRLCCWGQKEKRWQTRKDAAGEGHEKGSCLSLPPGSHTRCSKHT